MAIYATSDLHGYPFEDFQAFLKSVNFNENDFLFVLGDVIDRGNDGVKYLTWLMNCPNAELLLGNHEAMLLSNQFLFTQITEESLKNVSYENLANLSDWNENGAKPTIDALNVILRESPEAVQDILDFLSDSPLYETVSVGGRDFFLSHSGIDNFSPDKRISSYDANDFIWHRPDLEDRYFDDIIIVHGHTPTEYYGFEYKGKILKTPTWIDIDTGAAGNGKPCLLRLDDLKEFYM